MAETLDIAYLYARVCGAFSNMRLGDKAGELMQNSGGIVGLWRLLFDEEAPSIVEARLVFETERRIIKRAIDNFVRLTKPFSDSSEFIRALISKYEISTIKSMLFRLRSGEPKPEATTYFSNIIGQALARWPRITDMFSDTPYSWLDSHWLDKIAMAENELDKQYYLELWKAALGLPRQKVGAIPELIRWEVIYQNIVWAIRMSRYYGLSKEDIADTLVYLPQEDTTSLALETFSYDLERIGSFDSWRLKKLLSNQTGMVLDVPALEIRVLEDLFFMVRRSLHLYPFSYTPIYCYFKLLDYETSLLLAVLESTRLSVTPEEKIKYVWIPGGGTA